MILADTSAWVEFDRATGSPADLRITELLRSGGDLAITEPIAMELLAGAASERHFDDVTRLMSSVHLLGFDPVADFEAAARIYRRCRAEGVTPRGMIDCMIAAVAWRRNAALLSCDIDLARVAAIIGVTMDEASAR